MCFPIPFILTYCSIWSYCRSLRVVFLVSIYNSKGCLSRQTSEAWEAWVMSLSTALSTLYLMKQLGTLGKKTGLASAGGINRREVYACCTIFGGHHSEWLSVTHHGVLLINMAHLHVLVDQQWIGHVHKLPAAANKAVHWNINTIIPQIACIRQQRGSAVYIHTTHRGMYVYVCMSTLCLLEMMVVVC